MSEAISLSKLLKKVGERYLPISSDNEQVDEQLLFNQLSSHNAKLARQLQLEVLLANDVYRPLNKDRISDIALKQLVINLKTLTSLSVTAVDIQRYITKHY